MGKRGPKPDPNAMKTFSVRVFPNILELLRKHGNSEYWRNILAKEVKIKAELDNRKEV